jgi:thiol:disulfide interchange protein DsbC
MKKIALFLGFLAAISFAASDKEVEGYLSDMVKKNPQLTLKSVKILGREKLDKYDGWDAVRVLLEYTANDKQKGKINIKQGDMFFTKGDMISPEIIDVKTGKNLKDIARPKLQASHYNDEHFVVGNKNSKNKIVIFSDPLCPFCRDHVPDIIKVVAKNPTKAGVWHYSFPLALIHPASVGLIKAELFLSISKKISPKDLVEKFYTIEIDPNIADEEKIAAEVTKYLKIKVTKEDMNSKEVLAKYEKELDTAYNLIIRGTPSVFIGGEFDSSRTKIEELMKELK